MFKRTCTLGIILVLFLYIIKCIIVGISNIELAEFKKAGVVFLLDISNPDKKALELQEETIIKICKRLDVEDKTIIYVLSDSAYRIYSENPHKSSAIRKAFSEHDTFDTESYVSAYGAGLKEAVDDALNLKKQGYKPAIVVLGDLENSGEREKQIDWNTLPVNMSRTMKFIPDLSLVFLYASPEKLERARLKLKGIVPENQLYFSPEENVDLTVKRFMKSVH